MNAGKPSPNWAWKPPKGVQSAINRGTKKDREFMKRNFGQFAPTASRKQP